MPALRCRNLHLRFSGDLPSTGAGLQPGAVGTLLLVDLCSAVLADRPPSPSVPTARGLGVGPCACLRGQDGVPAVLAGVICFGILVTEGTRLRRYLCGLGLGD